MLAARTETACADKFVVLRPLAMGGMAEILLARINGATPERLVVLKRMHRQFAFDRDHVAMFMDEARLATTLRHPNVVEVYEFGEEHGQYYIVMEYLHGHDLRRVLSEMAKRAIPIRLSQALAIITGVCRGLDYTHERTRADGETLGIVHRDVSPHNVHLTYLGKVKLLDFGIAKATSQLARTRTGILKGKAAYMSPEQAMGEDLDRRSDVFSIGILLWEMTTGQWLYRRKSELETLKAVAESDAPLPSSVHPGYPRDLEQIVMKTLSRKREDRWATAGQLADAIGEFAARHRINLVNATLGAMMQALFAEEVAAWQDARRAGATLGDHLVHELEREERKDGSDGDSSGGRAAALQSFDNATLLGEHESGNEDFDSPTADHSLEEREEAFDAELEDEPTMVLQPSSRGPQTPARGVQLAQSQPRALPALPLQAPSDPSPDEPSTSARANGANRKRAKPTVQVRTVSAPPEASPQRTLERFLAWLGLADARLDRRWIWLIATSFLALIATVWLIATLLSEPELPGPTKPAKPVPMEHPLG
jgi:eukaryotic-like serine/threonine-protein kinase